MPASSRRVGFEEKGKNMETSHQSYHSLRQLRGIVEKDRRRPGKIDVRESKNHRNKLLGVISRKVVRRENKSGNRAPFAMDKSSS